MAKEITCSSNDYNARIKIDKDSINIDGSAFISISSNNQYEVIYRVDDNTVASIDENGIVKAINEGKVSINIEINFLKENKIDGTCNAKTSLEIVSSDATLKSLTLEELDISSLFHSDTYEYNIKLPYKYEKINIIAEASNNNAKIVGDGRRYLNEGTNEFDVIVTATDGSTKTYKIVIEREEANNDATLKELIVEGYVLNPKFDKDTYKYTLNLSKEVERITINAIANDVFAEITGTGEFVIASGTSIYEVLVNAQDGSQNKYEIVINKNNGSSKLKSLLVTDVSLQEKFDSDTFIYHANVNSNIDKLDIKATAIDNDQVEIINNDKLEYGDNEIIIRVTSKDKSTTTYKIIVKKLSKTEEKELKKNNRLLKVLFIMFILGIITMFTLIGIFIKRNYKGKLFNLKKKRIIKKK